MRNVVLVCGGRDFNDPILCTTLTEIHRRTPITAIVHGGATGADSLASIWAKSNLVLSVEYTAEWEKFGKAAGPRRNRLMLRDARPNLVVAFPGGKGTAHMVKIAKAAGVEVREVEILAAEKIRVGPWASLPNPDGSPTRGADPDSPTGVVTDVSDNTITISYPHRPAVGTPEQESEK